MKKISLISVGLFVCSCTFGQNGSIVNGGFENWSNNILFENPDIWLTGNNISSDIVATKSTDKVGGNYSIRLESIINGNDTAFGFALHGQIGNNGPEGGIPYSDVVDTIKGWYKYATQPGDSNNILIEFKNGGNIVSQDLIKFAGTQNTWTKFAYPINAGLATPDSVVLGFVAGNALGSGVHDSTWLMLDDVSFASSVTNTPANIPNSGFEAWSDIQVEDADDWYSMNSLLNYQQLVPARKTADAHSGTYGAELETMTVNYGADTLTGVLAKGFIDYWAPSNGTPYTWQPDTFRGYYKYAPVGNDTAYISVQFSANANVIDQHWITITGTVNAYTLFEQQLNVGSVPDSMQIVMWSGNMPGSILKVDDLEFIGGNVGVSEVKTQVGSIILYPNPAKDACTLEYFSAKAGPACISIYNVLGDMVYNQTYSAGIGLQHLPLNLQDMEAGIYLLKLEINGQFYSQKLTLE